MNDKPIKKDAYDWRDGVCKTCGIKALSGCCEAHNYHCPMCRGWGAISKKMFDSYLKESREKRNSPPNQCCDKCTDYFAHSRGSHADDFEDREPCYCNKNSCDWVYCECHIKN